MPKEVAAICTIGAPKNTHATPNAQDQPAKGRQLPEEVRHKLAILLNVEEESLRGDDAAARPTPFYFTIPFIDAQASAGHGSIAADHDSLGQSWVFHRSVLKTIYSGNPDNLRL
jgi:hypothetical protein